MKYYNHKLIKLFEHKNFETFEGWEFDMFDKLEYKTFKIPKSKEYDIIHFENDIYDYLKINDPEQIEMKGVYKITQPNVVVEYSNFFLLSIVKNL